MEHHFSCSYLTTRKQHTVVNGTNQIVQTKLAGFLRVQRLDLCFL